MPHLAPWISRLRVSLARALTIGLVAACALPSTDDAQVYSAAARARARGLHAIAVHAQWPRRSFATAESPFVIGVIGASEVAGATEYLLRDRKLKNYPFRVIELDDVNALAGCHLLYVGDCSHEAFLRLLAHARGRNVLIVQEKSSDTTPGASIVMYEEHGRLRLEIHRALTARNEVRLGAQLLTLADNATVGQSK